MLTCMLRRARLASCYFGLETRHKLEDPHLLSRLSPVLHALRKHNATSPLLILAKVRSGKLSLVENMVGADIGSPSGLPKG